MVFYILNVEFRYKLYSIEPRIDLLTDDSGRGPSAGDLAAKTGSLNPVILRYGSLNPVILRNGSLNPVIPRYRQEPYRTGRIYSLCP